MQKRVCKIRTFVVGVTLILFFPIFCIAEPTNFLPMEDAMSAARNAPAFVSEYPKTYRQSFNLGEEESSGKDYFDFTTSDICAFIALAGIYAMFVRKGSKSRNASF